MKQSIQVVIPMAGFGSRLRPLTWSKPKPLIHLAGRTSLDFLLDEFKSLEKDFTIEYIFIISPNGWQIKDHMEANYPDVLCRYVVQEKMKGQSHAILLAKHLISGPMIMTFSDTLMAGDLSFLKDATQDGIAWVQWNPEPQRFGVAIEDENKRIVQLIEKPATDEHKQVIIGFYYFKEGKALISAIEEQIRDNVSLKGEFYIADAINIMLKHGAHFTTHETDLWLDSGVPGTVLSSNQYYLDHGFDNTAKAKKRQNVTFVGNVFIAADAEVENAVIGPSVSIASGCTIRNSVISNAVIGKNTSIHNKIIKDSLIGDNVKLESVAEKLFIGDNSTSFSA
jgi:glucose-1-phosphate thymidylyltransferase